MKQCISLCYTIKFCSQINNRSIKISGSVKVGEKKKLCTVFGYSKTHVVLYGLDCGATSLIWSKERKKKTTNTQIQSIVRKQKNVSILYQVN